MMEVIDAIKQQSRENLSESFNPQKVSFEEWAIHIKQQFTFKTFLKDTKEILYYLNGVYHFGGEALIAIACQQIIPDCTNHIVSEVTNIIKRMTACERDDFNKDFSKIVVNNGILNLETLELEKHKPEYLSTVKIPVDYDPNARCPKFIKFLNDCLDPHDAITVVEGMANILTGNKQNFEVSFIWVGDGSNGKSTALKIIIAVIGSENCSHVSIHSMNYDRFSFAQLEGKLVNSYADISNRELNNLGTFKQLVSGDPVSAQKKNQHPFNLQNFAKMFFSANEMPNIIDNSDGAFRRIYVIKWKNQFLPGVNRIDNFDQMIIDTEKSGIFNLMVQNYKTLIRNNGFRYRQNIAQVRETIKRESDKLKEFIDECLVKTPNEIITKDQLYEVYQKYCSHNNYEIFTKTKFSQNLPTYGFHDGQKRINGKNNRIWLNLSFNKESEFIKNNVRGLIQYV